MKNIDRNIVKLSDFKFPVGVKAWHDKYTVCTVIEIIGDKRRIRVLKKGEKDIIFNIVTVPLSELKNLSDLR